MVKLPQSFFLRNKFSSFITYKHLLTNSRNLHYSKTHCPSEEGFHHLRIVGIYTIPKLLYKRGVNHSTGWGKPTNSRNLHYSKTYILLSSLATDLRTVGIYTIPKPDQFAINKLQNLRTVGIYTIPKPQIILDYHPAV